MGQVRPNGFRRRIMLQLLAHSTTHKRVKKIKLGRYLPPKIQRVVVKYKNILFGLSRFFDVSPAHWIRFFKLAGKEHNPFHLNIIENHTCKVACIFDEFSFECFQPEANFMQIDLTTWQSDLENFKPDMILIESAWRGKGGKWTKKISKISNELIDVLYWAQKNSIPTVFWHKEVPPHFSTFMQVTKMFDYIFLTDADCVLPYRKKVGHERVYFLPFACQPKIHHPIQESARVNAMIYAGSFYPEYKYPDRYKNFMDICDGLSPLIKIDIYDRNAGKDIYPFPEKFQKDIKGSLPFAEVCKAYRSYEYGLNMNSVKKSGSMCSRRVFELIASNTYVIGNASVAVKNFFGDLTICSDSKTEIIQKFTELQNDPLHEEKIKLLALRKIMNQHTYGSRFGEIVEKISSTSEFPQERIIVVGMATSLSESEKIQRSFDLQKYKNKKLKWLKDNYFENLKKEIAEADLVAVFSSDCYYGENYLLDLKTAFQFSDADVITKKTFYQKTGGSLKVQNAGFEYRHVDSFVPHASLIRTKILNKLMLPESDTTIQNPAVSIDRFNFCDLGRKDIITTQDVDTIADVKNINTGLSLNEIGTSKDSK